MPRPAFLASEGRRSFSEGPLSRTTQKLVIGTRASALAVAQTGHVADRLKELHPGLEVELVRIHTSGDKDLDRPLHQMGGKGVFTKELDDALLDGRIDAAVHSLKDVPTDLPEGIEVVAHGPRATPFDVLITLDGLILDELPDGAKVGTSSLRRRAQLLRYREDLELVEMRGNLETRWRKLEAKQVDALVLAAAGLERLGWQDRVSEILTQDVMVPAVGQGILAVTARSDDARVRGLVDDYDDEASRASAECERGFLAALGGGCQVPAGALAQLIGNQVAITAVIASPDGWHYYKGDHQGRKSSAAAVGKRLAIDLLDQGGDKVVAAAREAQG
jgi:hydroxymethylbilane synthase